MKPERRCVAFTRTVGNEYISCTIPLPHGIKDDKVNAVALEEFVHNHIELALKGYFNRSASTWNYFIFTIFHFLFAKCK